MSTKIYTGFRIDVDDLAKLGEVLTPFRDAVQAQMRRRTHTFWAIRASEILDRRTLGLPSEKDAAKAEHSPFSVAVQELAERQKNIRLTQRRDPVADMEVKLWCWHYPALGAVIGIVSAEDRNEAYQELLSLPGVQDFSYWNNSDSPEDVSEAEWAEREAAWDFAYSTAAPASFEVVIEQPYIRPSPEEVLEYVPALEVRCRKFAHNELCNQWMAETMGPEALKGLMPSESVGRYLEFCDLVKSDEVLIARMGALAQEFKARLASADALLAKLVEQPAEASSLDWGQT